MKNSKELKNIIKAIEQYVKKHKNNVQFIGSFMAFKGEDFEVVDDIILGYGIKKTLLIDIKELKKMVKKEKEDFVNW